MADRAELLVEEYTIDTPENVTFGFEVAGIGNRFIAALLDSIALGVFLLLLNIVLMTALGLSGDAADAFFGGMEGEISWIGGLVIALYALLNFGLIWGYFLLFELLWNGQTPGKRLTGIRVVRMDGNPARFVEVAVRNLVRVIDFLPAGYGVGLVTMFMNRHARRLGDFAAGTLVVKEHTSVDLASLDRVADHHYVAGGSNEAAIAQFAHRFPTINRLRSTDADLINEVLVRHAVGQVEDPLLRRTAEAIAAKLGIAIPDDDYRLFLTDVAQAYRILSR